MPASAIYLPQGAPSHTAPHFQEESKEEQTAMVPQAIPLRRCRYCMVLVGDAGTSWEGSGARLRLPDLLLPQRLGLAPLGRGKASQIQTPNSQPPPFPHRWVQTGASIEPDSLRAHSSP